MVDKESSVMYRSLAPLFDPETKTLKLPAGVTDLGGYPVEGADQNLPGRGPALPSRGPT